jgi:hypothetical protein
MSVEGYRRLAGDLIQNDNMRKCYDECYKLSEFDKVSKEVKEFNEFVSKYNQRLICYKLCRKNRFRKRGICIMPTRYPLGHAGTWEQVSIFNKYVCNKH